MRVCGFLFSRTIAFGLVTALIMVLTSTETTLAAKVGEKAPDFELVDTNGKTHKLSSFAGKTVVLEWFNKGCPYVQKHYDSANMQRLQKTYTGKGVIWLTVISSAPGKQGFELGPEANKTREDWKIASTATLLDPKGEVGKLYAAKTTPHMYIVDATGNLVYNGAIDSISSSKKADVAKAENFVAGALELIAAGKPVEKSSTKPYGCSVKY